MTFLIGFKLSALDWSPWQQNILATGGGKQDGILCVSNVTMPESPIYSINVGAQLCSVIWSRNNSNELLSAHGLPKENLSSKICPLADRNLILWDYPSLQCIGSTKTNPSQIIDTALSPDGEHVIGLGVEKSLRLFKCFSKIRSKPRVDTFRLHKIR